MPDVQNMSTNVILQWQFSPRTYFEEPRQIPHSGCIITIADGKVEARFDASVYDQDPSIREPLHNTVVSLFRGAQLVNQKPYQLSPNPTIIRLASDGSRGVSVEVAWTAGIVLGCAVGCAVDIQVLDKDGKVVRDSRQERIAKRNGLADLAERHAKDPVALNLLKSFDTAMNDPPNELIHLYEIRDALKTKFGGDGTTPAALSISRRKWSRFGKLADDEPLKQGRHRGIHASALRDATNSELNEARDIARGMIEAYLQYLEKPPAIGG
jgi:hypothetical protein